MIVSVVGVGALGRVYGARLAADGAEVTFVARREVGAVIVEQVNGPRKRDEIDEPTVAREVAPNSDCVIVAVHTEQVAAVLPLLSAAPRAAVVLLTPTVVDVPGVIAGMPGVVAYATDGGVVRYWATSLATTLLDAGAPAAAEPTLEELAQRLTRAGIPTRIEADVARTSHATSIAFYPLIAAVAAGGGVDGVIADKELLALALDAARECEPIAKSVGSLASWATLLMRFVGPFTLKPGVALAQLFAPEAVRFVDAHFGDKLLAQHLDMGATILDIAARQGAPVAAVEKLVALLRARS